MLQYYIVTVILILEVILLALLLLPLPDGVLEGVLNLMGKIKVPMRFIFVGLLFFTVDQTMEMRREEQKADTLGAHASYDKEAAAKTRKFRAERNFYLVSFTFVILLILLRLEVLLRNAINNRRELNSLRSVQKVK